MKYLIWILIIMVVGCHETLPEADPKVSTETNNKYESVVIDSCEYIQYDAGVFDQRVYAITHKGNCKYCIERHKTETK